MIFATGLWCVLSARSTSPNLRCIIFLISRMCYCSILVTSMIFIWCILTCNTRLTCCIVRIRACLWSFLSLICSSRLSTCINCTSCYSFEFFSLFSMSLCLSENKNDPTIIEAVPTVNFLIA